MTLRKKLSAVLTSCALVASVSVMTAGPAQATGGSCGSGYYFLDSYPLTYYRFTGGYLSLYYNSSNGYNCAITRVKAEWDGKANDVHVSLSNGHDRIARDPALNSDANYHYYAGPVYLYLRDQCAYVSGYLSYGGHVYKTHVDHGVHCD